MHTTTKKNLGRSTRAGVIGRSSVSSPLCARCIVRSRVRTRESRVCARAYWDKELCKHEFTSGGHYCPGPGASYPSGTSLAQSFLLVTLPVTSTSMRYDRYDTCLYVRSRALVPIANALRIATNWLAGTSRFRRDASTRELFSTASRNCSTWAVQHGETN